MPPDKTNDIPDKVIDDLENPPVKEPDESGKETEPKVGETVPYNEDPKVQAYIERQVAKRYGEGNEAWEERISRIEKNLTKSTKKEEPVTIGGWTPANDAEARAAKAIIKQAKDEVVKEFRTVDERARKTHDEEDRKFSTWITELRETGTLKSDDDEKEFTRLVAEYDPPQDKAVELWNKLQQSVSQAKEEGEKTGIKKMQEPVIGSGRKGKEPGTRERSYQERRAQEPTFDAILEREMSRLGY